MKILAIEKECANTTKEQFERYLRPEALKVWELYQKGIIREAYFQSEQHQAVLVLESIDLHEAQAAIASLPLVEADLITFDLLPLIPYDGFARLFMPMTSIGPT